MKASTFLMFDGKAEEAIRFYVDLFPDATLTSLIHHPDGKGVYQGRFTLGGHDIICFDSPGKHGFTFTPATSIFVECNSAAEVDRLSSALLEGGTALMPLGSYPFAPRFAWIVDRFGISWQLILPPEPQA